MTARIDRLNEASPVSPAISVAVTVISMSPEKLGSGITDRDVPSMLTEPPPSIAPGGSTEALNEITSSRSTSFPDTVISKISSSKMVSFTMASTVGASFTGFTVSVKEVEFVYSPSLTTTVTAISPE